MPFTVEVGDTKFSIVGPNGYTSEPVAYGEVAILVEGDEVYICRMDAEDNSVKVERVSQTEVMPTIISEVDDDDEAGTAGDDDEEGDDDDPDGGEELEVEEKRVA